MMQSPLFTSGLAKKGDKNASAEDEAVAEAKAETEVAKPVEEAQEKIIGEMAKVELKE